VKLPPGGFGAASRKELGVNDFTKDRKAIHDPWTVAAEVSPAIHGVDAFATDGAEARPPDVTSERISLAERSFKVEAARHEDDNLRIVFRHVVPMDLTREGTFTPHLVMAAGQTDHFGNPVPSAIRRV